MLASHGTAQPGDWVQAPTSANAGVRRRTCDLGVVRESAARDTAQPLSLAPRAGTLNRPQKAQSHVCPDPKHSVCTSFTVSSVLDPLGMGHGKRRGPILGTTATVGMTGTVWAAQWPFIGALVTDGPQLGEVDDRTQGYLLHSTFGSSCWRAMASVLSACFLYGFCCSLPARNASPLTDPHHPSSPTSAWYYRLMVNGCRFASSEHLLSWSWCSSSLRGEARSGVGWPGPTNPAWWPGGGWWRSS